MKSRRHEEWAGGLLADALRARGLSPITWERGDDPPDLIFTVGEEKWAVEVTRVDQRVKSSTGTRSRTDVDTKLAKFGSIIKAEHGNTLPRPYVLVLYPRSGVTDTKRWRDHVRKAITHLVKTGGIGPFYLDPERCAKLHGGEPGNSENAIFTVIGATREATPEGHASADIISNLEEAIRYVLNDKAKKLDGITGFDRVVLVFENRYWLADIGDARRVAEEEAPAFPIFHSIFMIHANAIHEIYRGR